MLFLIGMKGALCTVHSFTFSISVFHISILGCDTLSLKLCSWWKAWRKACCGKKQEELKRGGKGTEETLDSSSCARLKLRSSSIL